MDSLGQAVHALSVPLQPQIAHILSCFGCSLEPRCHCPTATPSLQRWQMLVDEHENSDF